MYNLNALICSINLKINVWFCQHFFGVNYPFKSLKIFNHLSGQADWSILVLTEVIMRCWHTSQLSRNRPSPEAIIRFGATKFSVSEPSESGQISVVRISVQRTGDTSKVSVVRVHTKDGSASSGEDYHPISEGGFKHNIIAQFCKTTHRGISQEHVLPQNHNFNLQMMLIKEH